MTVGEYLKECRTRLGKSQVEIGKELIEKGIIKGETYAQKYVCRIERGVGGLPHNSKNLKILMEVYGADEETVKGLPKGKTRIKSCMPFDSNIMDLLAVVLEVNPKVFTLGDLHHVLSFQQRLDVPITPEITQSYLRSFLVGK